MRLLCFAESWECALYTLETLRQCNLSVVLYVVSASQSAKQISKYASPFSRIGVAVVQNLRCICFISCSFSESALQLSDYALQFLSIMTLPVLPLSPLLMCSEVPWSYSSSKVHKPARPQFPQAAKPLTATPVDNGRPAAGSPDRQAQVQHVFVSVNLHVVKCVVFALLCFHVPGPL